MCWVSVLGASQENLCLPASAQESEDKAELRAGSFTILHQWRFIAGSEESLCVRAACWLCIFLSPNTDNVRLFEDLAVIHTAKYSLKLLKSDPSFMLLG